MPRLSCTRLAVVGQGRGSLRDAILSTALPETLAYIAAVEAADGEQLETGALAAMVTFANYRIPLGGYCLFPIGARTLPGALIPMLGPAPTAENLVEGDYSRTLGIKGDAVNKRILLNYPNGTYGGRNSRLAGVWLSERDTSGANIRVITGGVPDSGRFVMRTNNGPGVGEGMQYVCNGAAFHTFNNYVDGGLLVAGRQNNSEHFIYNNSTRQTNNAASQAPFPFDTVLFSTEAGFNPTDARIAMFTDSAYTDPAEMDTNMTAAVNAIAAALA